METARPLSLQIDEALQPVLRISDELPLPRYLQVTALILLLSTVWSFLTREKPLSGFPLIEPNELKWLPSIGWMKSGKEMLFRGLAQTKGAFQVMTGTGPKIVLPNRYADELRNHPDLNFPKAFAKDLFITYPGFEPHKTGLTDGTFIQEVVRVKLTQSLSLVTNDLVDECTKSFHDLIGEDSQWHVVPIKDNILDIVARLSSRVFLGEDLAHNQRWLEIAKDYTIDSFAAAFELRLIPGIIRPFVHWVLPRCRRLRANVRDAEKLIMPEVQKRIERVRKAHEAGVKPPKMSDTIGWMYEVSRGRKVNYVHGQLSLSLAAIHTTAETTTQAILDLCQYPELQEQLRQEAVDVLSKEGWAKTSLYKLKLMDSFLKESQRTNAMSWHSMNRYVDKDITLSDGTFLPKGSRFMVSADTYINPTLYPEPEKFRIDRFLSLRNQPGQENNWQFVTTSANHMTFGHGQHACPGRFFASNEIKIAMCFFLLKYDMKLCEGEGRPPSLEFEGSNLSNPKAKIQIRRRQEEIEIDITEPVPED
ncbi:Ent-kaurene oxidase [Sphaceloma murrayae]|uniref:Ent-kaurene oxidase n=1 Tax=Sphaceloma murrayae TaxID=2082308 RepID=A0A2K1QR25_9PEZI|nr:Ent-kaurene oxidase [Sphaceloma murrayae]